jgi:tellurite resistance protein TerC
MPAVPDLGFPPITTGIFVTAFILSLLIDLLQHKGNNEISMSNAIGWSIFWICLSLGFYAWLRYGLPMELSADHAADSEKYASLFLTGYVLEKVLSIDNLIVFIAVFKFFNIKDVLQHKILYYGILGAIIFRGVFVALGASLLHYAEAWAELVFGILIGYAAIQMLGGDDDESEEDPDYESMFLVKIFNKIYPIFPGLVGNQFFVDRQQAQAEIDKGEVQATLGDQIKRWMTPAFVCLLVIEGSDVLFAFDSVPAVIAVTKQPLLVYSAMIFAILGLRSLYFVLVVLTKYLVHLEKAVLWVLVFISLKMFIAAFDAFKVDYKWEFDLPSFLHFDHNTSMYIVLGIIGLGVIASLVFPEKDEDAEEA